MHWRCAHLVIAELLGKLPRLFSARVIRLFYSLYGIWGKDFELECVCCND